MKPFLIFSASLGLSLFATAADAQIYRCTENGKVMYTQTPCSDAAERIDLGPNAEVAVGAREAALLREIEQLREDVRRLQQAQQNAAAPQQFGRSEADLRAEQASSYACSQATRSYELSANSVRRNDVDQKRTAMYAACGMREPDRIYEPERFREPYRRGGTTVIVR